MHSFPKHASLPVAPNRERWLQHAAAHLTRVFADKGVAVPPVQVSCSWPGGGSARKRIGECWPSRASRAGVNEIFISPVIEDSGKALSILAHELIHAADDCKHGHRAPFTKLAKRVGLEGKPTQCGMSEADRALHVALVEAVVGKFPHRAIDLSAGRKKQTTRMLKCACPCTAIWRMTQAVINMAEDGLHCPVCGSDEVVVGG